MDVDTVVMAGAGLATAVLARELVERTDLRCLVLESNDHIGGHCHSYRDDRTGIMVHAHGPHIFHTVHEDVWAYLNRFASFEPYQHRIKAVTARGIFGLPINLHTINQFFGKTFDPDEARRFVASLGDASIEEPDNVEEQALRFIGKDLYEAFFRDYTKKHWGRDPRELPASILKRLPVRFTYDDNYYDSRYTAIPANGYSAMIEAMFDHPDIEVQLGTEAGAGMCGEFRHMFWSGTIDGFFGHRRGRLGYRTLEWDKQYAIGDLQGAAQINYTSMDVPYTRICEHKFFTPWEHHAESVAFVETSRDAGEDDIPYYPLRLEPDRALYAEYETLARELENVSFIGRLGTYRYLDMDTVVKEMLDFAGPVCEALLDDRGRVPHMPLPAITTAGG